MSETVQSEFSVKGVVNGDVWLKDLSNGLTVAVEAADNHYSTEFQQKIRQLSEGDLIEATLESQNQLHTIWTFDNIEVQSGTVTA